MQIKQTCGMAVAIFLTIFASPAFSTPVSTRSDSDTLLFDMETVNLASVHPQLSRLDVYVRVVYDELQFVKASNDSFMAKYTVDVTILNSAGEKVDAKDFGDKVMLATIDEVNSREKFMMSRVTFELPPDQYQVVVKVEDVETRRSSQTTGRVELRQYSDDELRVSDILFLDDIRRGEDGKLIFQPRVSSMQSKHAKILVYFEVYNVAPTDSFWVEYEVLSADDSVALVDKYWSKSERRITQNFIDIQGETLSHGDYRVKVKIKYQGKTRKIEKSFNWHLEGLPGYFSNIDEAIEVLKYLTSNQEYEYLRNLEEEDKHVEFLNFWKRRDPTPETSENELLDEYYGRVAYANSNFAQMGKVGWKTDRGWVYVLLGPPDNINRRPYNNRTSPGKTVKAIQVWVYYKYNRQLVFFDDNGFGAYRLENPSTLYEILR
ncbi:MAG: GWxTD domain-containing protein [bacterium]